MIGHQWQPRFSSFMAVLIFAAMTIKPALAADIYWVGETGVWDDTNNWSLSEGGPGGADVPGPDDDARVVQSGTTNNVVTYQGNNPAVDFLPIDATGTGTITFSLSQDDLAAREIQVGRDGTGTFNQSGGANTVENVLLMGRRPGTFGTYNFSGGTITALGQIVGHEGAGLFDHTGGTNNISVSLQIAALANSEGTYRLSNQTSTLTTPESFVGAFGDGTFVQTGGTHTVDKTPSTTGSLTLGFSGGSRGSYDLSDGTLQVDGNEFVSVVGRGTFTQTGGIHRVGDMSAGTGDLNIGYADQFGQDADRSGVFNLAGGELEVSDDTFVGFDGIGVLNQTQGTHTIGDRLVLGSVTTAARAGTPTDVIGNGVYNLNNGNVSSENGEIGEFGLGTFNQTGGRYTVNNLLQIGKEATGIGTYNLLNGDLSASSLVVGESGTGTFSQIGGTNTIDSLDIAASNGSTGTYNLKGGSLTATNTISNGGTFNFSGGTLTATTFVNDGSFVLSGDGNRLINGDMINNAIIKTNAGTTPVFVGTFTNNGLLVNDPTFIGDAVVVTNGVFTEDPGGNDFIFGRDFINESRMNDQWRTGESLISFVNTVDLGTDGVFNTQLDHDLFLPSVDMGADIAGFSDNFAWDTLSLASGNRLTLVDGNADVSGGALYVMNLLLEDGVGQIDHIIGNGLNIYYVPNSADNAYLGGQSFNLQGGGQIIPIPEPSAFLLMVSVMLFCITRRHGTEQG